MFKQWFNRKPKWQHDDERVRRRAIADLGRGDRGVLRQVVEGEPVHELRVLAVGGVEDVAYLFTLLESDRKGDLALRQVVSQRLGELLQREGLEGVGLEESSATLEGWCTRLGQCGAADTVAQLALHAASPEVRKAAIEQLEDDASLEAVVKGEKSAALRLAAAERLTGREALERVHREMRKRDKQVVRRARERLDALNAAEERPRALRQAADALLQQLESLLAGCCSEQDEVRLAYLNEQWASLSEEAGELLEGEQQRYQAVAEACRQRLGTYARERAEQQGLAEVQARQAALLAQLEAMEGELESELGGADEAALSGFRLRLDEIRQRWRDAEALAPPVSELAEGFRRSSAALAQQLEGVKECCAAGERAEQQCEALEAMLATSATSGNGKVVHLPRAEASLKRLRQSLQQLPNGERRGTLQGRVEALAERLQQVKTAQQDRSTALIRSTSTWLDRLEEALEAGSSREATALHGKLESALHYFEQSGEKRSEVEGVRQRIGALQPRFAKLREWRDWAVVNERERLCVEMEALEGLNVHPTTRLEQLQALQQEWRRLDATKARASRALWNRFKAASDRAYEPVAAHRQQEAEQRRLGAEARRAFVEALEDEINGMEWSRVDWKPLQRREREIHRQWRELGAVAHAEWEALKRAFDTQMARLEERLKPEQARCRQRRLELIEQLEALAGSADGEQAAAEARRLQSRWEVTVAGRKGEERALWKRFQAAMDGVSKRCSEQRLTQERAAEASRVEKLALCDALVAAAEGWESLERGPGRLAEFERDWRGAGTVARGAERAVESRRRAAVASFEARLERLNAAQEADMVARLEACSALCLALEEAAVVGEGDGAPERATWSARWQALEFPPAGPVLEAIRSRFEGTLATLDEGVESARKVMTETVERNRVRKAELCLRMEILAGVDSPEGWHSQRMALQVERLNQTMGSGEKGVAEAEAIRELADGWYATGFSGLEHEEGFDTRFRAAQEALQRSRGSS